VTTTTTTTTVGDLQPDIGADAFKPALGYNSLIAGTDLITVRIELPASPSPGPRNNRPAAGPVRPRQPLTASSRRMPSLTPRLIARPAPFCIDKHGQRRGRFSPKTGNFRRDHHLIVANNVTRNLLRGLRVSQPDSNSMLP